MYKIKTSNKMKLGKLKVRFSDALLSDTEMKNLSVAQMDQVM